MKPCRFRPFPALMVLAFILTGCAAASQQEPSADGPLDPKNPVTISIWNYYNGAQLSFFNDLVKKFNETDGKVQGIFVESFSQGSVNDLESNVLAAAQGKVGAGKIPNIFAAYADTAYAVDRLGLAADLSGYLTEEERAAFVDSYINEGRFSEEGGIKIFPVAKSTEIFMLNKTDWDLFSSATGASREDLATMEGLVRVAKAYYKWTDGLTPAPNDGRAFFGRDAMANYFLIGAMPLGCEIFTVRDGRLDLNFDHDVLRTLWGSYYVPYIKGYFASSGRFRSDDIKTGNIIALAGSSSGATFFPNQVIVSDTESYPIEVEVFACPRFEGGAPYAVQQGAGMVVTAGSEAEIAASVQFLKWLTRDENNISFSMASGYLPVTKSANNVETILQQQGEISGTMEQILRVAVDTVNDNTLYTPRAFEKGTSARAILEYSMSDLAAVFDRRLF
ncbi:lipoprotein [Eubacteriales bacterium]|nr:extracellular solute-binding protein [Faecalicatena sp. BF-R-105]GKH64788.1 lipoprotein [Eubacteriales bacterium]